MASNCEDAFDRSVSDLSETDTDSLSETDSDSETQQRQVCYYYNKGNCRNGTSCPDLHVCRYYLKGNCRYASECRLYHGSISNTASNNQETRSRSRRTQGHTDRSRSSSSGSDSDTDSRPYRWQLNLGNGWQDVENDYILEAQFSRPYTKGITIYNTPCGALSIDFTRMRILKKTNLRVRRRGSRKSSWLWYYRETDGWREFGKKDAQGNSSPVNSSTLESEFKENPCGTLKFIFDSSNYEIRFEDMCQKNLSTGRKRKIRRRPKFDSSQAEGVNTVTKKLKSMLTSSKKAPLWQFSGRRGKWHNFSPQGSCSVSSADIEKEFQSNRQGSMSFNVNGDQFILDFSPMATGEWFYSNNFNSMFNSMSAPETPPSLREKHYAWNLFDGKRWLEINNDFIIECNYCQPGTKGITIDTHLGSLYIDFDAMTLIGPYANLAVRRLSTMSQDQREDMGWFYRDNSFWCEYGEQGSSCSTSSVSSQDLELQYSYNPKGSYQFTTGKTLYILNFSDMMQTNLSTHKQRKVRRRPKFISTVYINNSLNTLEPSASSIYTFPSATQTVNPPTAVTWQFMDEEGIWKDYQKPNSSLDSMDIERQYQSSPHGQLDFRAGWYNYTLFFDGMYQINKTYKTTRAVQRIFANESKSSTLCQVIWQFKDMDGCWKDFIKGTGRGKCTISSQQIEMQYQQNRAGTIRFSSEKFNYQINFSDMTQTNLSTHTRRPVRRV